MRYALFIAIFGLLSPVAALGACQATAAARFAVEMASAFESGRLATLDEKYPTQESFEVYLEHSLADEEGDVSISVTYVKSFAELNGFINSRRKDGLPGLGAGALRKCANGVCSYNFQNGISHNTLYLKELRYNDYLPCLNLQTVWLLDGD